MCHLEQGYTRVQCLLGLICENGKGLPQNYSEALKWDRKAMSQNLGISIAVIGMDIEKNSFHIVGLDNRGAIVLRLVAWSGQSAVCQFRPTCIAVIWGS